MAATLPQNIPIPQSAAIASFNYTDIAEGTGIVKLYGATHLSNGTKSYYLTTNTPYSNNIVTSGGTALSDNEWHEIVNNDFDIIFNRPQNIKGYAFLNVTIGSTQGGAGTSTMKVLVSGAQMIKWDGSNETVLATTSGALHTQTDAAATSSTTTLLRFDLTGGPYHFKAGETLRLTVPLFAARTAGVNNFLAPGYGHDPQDRNAPSSINDSDTTQLNLYVPFLLNIV